MESINIIGAKQHNLKDITVEIPKNKLVTITGVSGSGKSSLAIDTLFAEGQRRYAESLNSYVRQFLDRIPKPTVTKIENLCPAISIDQKVASNSSRSTVGTLSEVYDYFKLLFARIGHTYSPISGERVKKDDAEDVWRYIQKIPTDQKYLLLLKLDTESDVKTALELRQRQGYVRVFSAQDEEIYRIDDLLEPESNLSHTFYLIQDRGVAREDWTADDQTRWLDSIERTFHEGHGECILWHEGIWKTFDDRFELDDLSFEIPSPDFFSFNNSYGACQTCEGFGSVLGIDEDLVIPNRSLSVFENAIACWRGDTQSKWKRDFIKESTAYTFPIHKPIRDLNEAQYELLWNGKGKLKGINDYFDFVNKKLYKIQYRVMLSRYRGRTLCHACKGTRVRHDAGYVKIEGVSIIDILNMSLSTVLSWAENLKLSKHDATVAERLLEEILGRLKIMCDIGLDYLTLSRSASTLSGGESQRIQLTRIIGSNLSESLYVLDEPSIGLHPRDSENLLRVLKNLKSLHNTVVVVEHEEVIIRNSDYLIDIGPGAGIHGGKVVATGKIQDVEKNKNSLTGAYLKGTQKIERVPLTKKPRSHISILGAQQNNLKDIDVKIPTQRLVAVCGVSGSGKSTLTRDILFPAISHELGHPSDKPGRFSEVLFDKEEIQEVEFVDQNPIGKSSRSNPLTYIKAYDEVRKLYANQKLSKIRGYQAGTFSFNTDGGRCDNCRGEGKIVVKMQFLADVELECDVCQGKQFNEDVLEVKYKGKNIHDFLNMSIEEAYIFLEEVKNLQKSIEPLIKVGLGYMQVGQSASTLSGGEAQRVKLASYIAQSSSGKKKLLIFDEPTTGLHFHDVQVLLIAFDELLKRGHTVVLVEHNLDVIRCADWIVELGPVGGEDGGYLLYSGDAKGIMKAKKSVTREYLEQQ